MGKLLMNLNDKDGEICVPFDEVKEALEQKENLDNRDSLLSD
jgi:hypothetical protein